MPLKKARINWEMWNDIVRNKGTCYQFAWFFCVWTELFYWESKKLYFKKDSGSNSVFKSKFKSVSETIVNALSSIYHNEPIRFSSYFFVTLYLSYDKMLKSANVRRRFLSLYVCDSVTDPNRNDTICCQTKYTLCVAIESVSHSSNKQSRTAQSTAAYRNEQQQNKKQAKLSDYYRTVITKLI